MCSDAKHSKSLRIRSLKDEINVMNMQHSYERYQEFTFQHCKLLFLAWCGLEFDTK